MKKYIKLWKALLIMENTLKSYHQWNGIWILQIFKIKMHWGKFNNLILTHIWFLKKVRSPQHKFRRSKKAKNRLVNARKIHWHFVSKRGSGCTMGDQIIQPFYKLSSLPYIIWKNFETLREPYQKYNTFLSVTWNLGSLTLSN